MRTNKDRSLLLVVALILCICVLAASCTVKETGECSSREYQIELYNDSTVIYDGERKVGVLLFDSTQAFDKLMIKDNE